MKETHFEISKTVAHISVKYIFSYQHTWMFCYLKRFFFLVVPI